MYFLTRLKEVRNNKKVTQKTVANYLQITERAYRSYELGTREPNFEKLLLISKYFDVSTDYLLGRTDNPNSHKL